MEVQRLDENGKVRQEFYEYALQCCRDGIEIWIDIDGYEGLYQVSNLGRFKRLSYYEPNLLTNGMSFYKEIILKLETTNKGYQRITLYKYKEANRVSVHRTVGFIFVPNPENKPQINHLDSNTKNNFASNFAWTTQSENIKYAYDNGRKHSSTFERKKGNDNRLSIKVIQFDLYWDIVNEFGSLCEAERLTGVSQANISRCLNSPLKNAGGFRWKTA